MHFDQTRVRDLELNEKVQPENIVQFYGFKCLRSPPTNQKTWCFLFDDEKPLPKLLQKNSGGC